MLKAVRDRLNEFADPADKHPLQRFFKTGPGEYAEGDLFLGVRVPATRKVAREFRDLSLTDLRQLLASKIHEERLLALLILTEQFRRGSADDQTQIYQLYLTNMQYINNWDLVDISAEHIVGTYLRQRSRQPLYQLAQSENLWQRRIAIMATFHFIKNDEFEETLKIASILLADTHDLIHKAVGWMLREIGNRDRETEELFLKQHYQTMPRAMLRYAIEKFPEALRQQYLKGTIK